MFFDVEHPQLERNPHKTRLGLKRYAFHKNQDSPESMIGLPDIRLRSKSTLNNYNPFISSVPSDDAPFGRLKEQIGPVERKLRPKPIDLCNKFSPKKRESPDSSLLKLPNKGIYNTFTPVPGHLRFGEPKYTKFSPKVFNSNPITGCRMFGNFSFS